MKKDLIFDIGGVLIGFCVQQMLKDYGLGLEEANRVAMGIFNDPIWVEFDSGNIEFEDTISYYKEKYPEDAVHMEYFLRHADLFQTNREEVWEKVIKLKKKGFRIYILSNYSRHLLEVHTKDMTHILDLADGKVISYEVHSVKPDEPIYLALLEKYNLDPANCIFFDDRKDNTDTASKLGITVHTIQSREHINELLDGLLEEETMDIKKVHLSSAKCNVDLGDGSERADYVNQDYILNQLGRPHRCINLMYTYYPNDEQWPERISEACADMEVSFAWDYPYDDYFPYGANGEPFNQIRDIRKHGQDVMLTITMDTKVSDEQLKEVARSLRPFGRLRLRINHECNGNWFTHNKRNTYEEVGAFFERASKIIKAEAPNIQTVFCAGLKEEDKDSVPYRDEFAGAYKEADIYSCDKYMALNYSWPYKIAEKGGDGFESREVQKVYDLFKNTESYLSKEFGKKKYILGEFNTDGDVTGGFDQPDSIVRFYEMVAKEDAGFLEGISMYQFRDKGRLGLEVEDSNNSSVGIRQPLFDAYKKLINMEYFMPSLEENSESVTFPAKMRWGGAEDADGIAIPVELEAVPVFFEVTYDADVTLMTEFLGRWFYKAKGVTTIDMMPLFYEAAREGRTEELMKKAKGASLHVFVTPIDGENSEDDLMNYYGTLTSEPKMRIRYEPSGVVL